MLLGRVFGSPSSSVSHSLFSSLRYTPSFFRSSSSFRAFSQILYTKDHEWVKVDGNKATVGITDFAQHSLGEIVFVDVPSPGLSVKIRDTVAVVESVKAAADVNSPIAGTVVEGNQDLVGSPDRVNSSPEGEGWIAVLEVTEDAVHEAKAAHMDADKYALFCETEGSH